MSNKLVTRSASGCVVSGIKVQRDPQADTRLDIKLDQTRLDQKLDSVNQKHNIGVKWGQMGIKQRSRGDQINYLDLLRLATIQVTAKTKTRITTVAATAIMTENEVDPGVNGPVDDRVSSMINTSSPARER